MTKTTRKSSPRVPPAGGPHPKAVEVRLEFTLPAATSASIAGTFNDWRPDSTPLNHLGDGRWFTRLRLPPGRYEYRLVVDGDWMADPNAAESAANPYGGLNSVFRVASP